MVPKPWHVGPASGRACAVCRLGVARRRQTSDTPCTHGEKSASRSGRADLPGPEVRTERSLWPCVVVKGHSVWRRTRYGTTRPGEGRTSIPRNIHSRRARCGQVAQQHIRSPMGIRRRSWRNCNCSSLRVCLCKEERSQRMRSEQASAHSPGSSKKSPKCARTSSTRRAIAIALASCAAQEGALGCGRSQLATRSEREKGMH